MQIIYIQRDRDRQTNDIRENKIKEKYELSKCII